MSFPLCASPVRAAACCVFIRSASCSRYRAAGRGLCFDGINELSGVSITSAHRWHHRLTRAFVEDFRADWLRPPTEAELAKVLEVYAAKGMTGACGSVDCTRLHVAKAPAAERNLNVGKSGRPEYTFEAVVGPDRYFLAFTHGHHGAVNDKAVAVTDAYVLRVRDGGFFPDVEYTLYDKNGVPSLHKGQSALA